MFSSRPSLRCIRVELCVVCGVCESHMLSSCGHRLQQHAARSSSSSSSRPTCPLVRAHAHLAVGDLHTLVACPICIAAFVQSCMVGVVMGACHMFSSCLRLRCIYSIQFNLIMYYNINK
jgi:hypothetical protein